MQGIVDSDFMPKHSVDNMSTLVFLVNWGFFRKKCFKPKKVGIYRVSVVIWCLDMDD
jgi:hypothetical protein